MSIPSFPMKLKPTVKSALERGKTIESPHLPSPHLMSPLSIKILYWF